MKVVPYRLSSGVELKERVDAYKATIANRSLVAFHPTLPETGLAFKGVIATMGYDRCARRGLLPEYKRMMNEGGSGGYKI
jgi:predicted nucleotide-binding protein (sugar kinase/HSP70/actin superfamily)